MPYEQFMNQTGSFISLDDWLSWLETLSPRKIDLGLDRVDIVLGKLNLPRVERVINVAGTNGKGSCVAMLEALLANAGYRIACYTSPHVLRYNERIRIDGFCAARRVERQHGLPGPKDSRHCR